MALFVVNLYIGIVIFLRMTIMTICAFAHICTSKIVFLIFALLVLQFNIQLQKLSSINAMGAGKQSVIIGTNLPSIFSQPKSSGGEGFVKTNEVNRGNKSAS